MKNQYVADINDFRKYGLIRALLSGGDLSCGVFWMLTNGDSTGDGELIGYLERPHDFAHLDPELFRKLRYLVETPWARTVRSIHLNSILPRTTYFDELLPDSATERRAVFAEGLTRLSESDLVFFDPDNGIEIQSKPSGRKNSNKYIYFEEIEIAFQKKHSLLVYQHFPRKDRRLYIEERIRQLRQRLGSPPIYALRTGYVCFFLIAQPVHHSALLKGVEQVRASWAQHFVVTAH